MSYIIKNKDGWYLYDIRCSTRRNMSNPVTFEGLYANFKSEQTLRFTHKNEAQKIAKLVGGKVFRLKKIQQLKMASGYYWVKTKDNLYQSFEIARVFDNDRVKLLERAVPIFVDQREVTFGKPIPVYFED